MKIRHAGAQVIKQEVVKVERGSWRGGRTWADLPAPVQEAELRDRLTKQASNLFGGVLGRSLQPIRSGALLTPEQLWKVYTMSPDVRAAVDSIARRISTWDWIVQPSVDAADEDRFVDALKQARAVTRFLRAPNQDGDTWQSFWTKLVTDALVFWHGAAEAAFANVTSPIVDSEGRPMVNVERGPLEEFVAVYGPSMHPVTDESGRLLGYVQDLTGQGAFKTTTAKETLIPLGRDQVIRLVISPNTRSPYAVPIIETIVQEVTTMVHSSERASKSMKSSEIPPGFLILTGAKPEVERGVKRTAEDYAGSDHKLRIIHTPNAQSPAQWLRLDHTMKELDFLPVTKQAQRAIWRAFGVTPIEMGDTEDSNRASALTELEVGSSHLIEPLLETIEALVNARMIPLVVPAVAEDADAEVLVEFGFDRSTKLSPEQELALARADEIRLKTGARSINELRVRDELPRIEGGDTYRIEGAGIGDEPLFGPQLDEDQAQDDAKAMGPSDEDEAPGEAEATMGPPQTRGPACRLPDETMDECVSRKIPELLAENPTWTQEQAVAAAHSICETFCTDQERDCGCPPQTRQRDRDDLPSEWQSPGQFDDARTINLRALWDEVVRYRRKVEPLWREARAKVLAVTGASHRAGTLGDARYQSELGSAMATLRAGWAMVTLESYQAVARVGRDSAREVTGNDRIGGETEATAEGYHRNAMVFLDQLISDVQRRVQANVLAARSRRATRAKVTAEDYIQPGAPLEDVFRAIEHSFDANENRVDNWSGRLVDLGNLAMAGAMAEAGFQILELTPGEEVDPAALEQDPNRGEWWVVWDAVLDGRTCDTCAAEASVGARPVSMLTVVPGGDTICGARCRCVLRWLTPDEASRL